MAFEQKTWANGEAGGTPITAAELNRLETGISDAHAQEQPAPAWGDVTGKPATFPAADHQHDASDINAGTLAAARIPALAQSKVTGLADALAGKADTSTLDAKADTSTVSDLAGRVSTLENAAPGFTEDEVAALKALLEPEA